MRFYLSPWLLLLVIFLSVATAVLILVRLCDSGLLWSSRWVHHIGLSVHRLAPQNPKDNWIEPLLIVGLFLQKRVCSVEVLFMPLVATSGYVSFGCNHIFNLVKVVWCSLVIIRFHFWPHAYYAQTKTNITLNFSTRFPASKNWRNWTRPLLTIGLSLQKRVCGLLMFYSYPWLLLVSFLRLQPQFCTY